jgi:hypothetical protein
MGHDSDGPLLAVWSSDSNNNAFVQARFSFLDPRTLKALKAGSLTNGGFQGIGSVSPSAGSIQLHPFFQQHVHVRASAGGDLFGIWHTQASPSGFQTLSVHGAALKGIYNHDGFDHLAPGPDGYTIYTGRAGALNSLGKPAWGSDSQPVASQAPTVSSSDPSYYLSIAGLGGNRPRNNPTEAITAAVHLAGDGMRLLTVRQLDEMGGDGSNESPNQDDFTLEKRFHLVPAANLMITVPFTNDRLVLRRLDIGKALDQLGGNYLIVTTSSSLYAGAGKMLAHQIEARGKAGGIRYALTQGPDDMTVSPEGKLNWLAPKGAADGDVVTAVVVVADSSGQERFHTLRIRIN